jgi:hypothetical protein
LITSVTEQNIVRLDHKSTTLADPALAWKILLDWRHWKRFADFYAELRWTHGVPWVVGSRLRMDVVDPDRFIVNRLVTMNRPPEAIAWIDHSRRTTVEQLVTFELDPDGMTCVHVVSQVLGPKPKVAGQPFIRFLDEGVKRWLDGYCKECDKVKTRA